MNINHEFKPFEIELKNKENESLVFTLRRFEKGDEKGVIDCIREEYGDTYFKRDFYDPDWLRENAVGDHFVFFLAQANGMIAGMTILTLFLDDEDYIEPASQIIRKPFRGYKLSDALVQYALPNGERMLPASLFVHAVTFHDSTQTLCEAYGMVPVGFRLGSFLSEKMHNSYDTKKCEKYSEGIMIKPVAKKDVGTVYVPDEIRDYTDKIYKRLKVEYNIADSSLYKDKEYRSETSSYDTKTDSVQKMVSIKVKEAGKDLADKMRELINSFDDRHGWVIQILLDIDSPKIYRIYDDLKDTGFFFTGLKPVCGAKEKMYMQWIGDISLNMDEYVLTESFDEIRHDIEKYIYRR